MAVSMAEPKWLILVAREHPELYELLGHALREEPSVKVAWERRQRSSAPRTGALPDRRRATLGVAAGLIAIAHPSDAGAGAPPSREPAGLGTIACPVCEITFVYETPTFPQPPARLDVTIFHGSAKAPQHTVELQAFSATGRLLLSHHTRANRRR